MARVPYIEVKDHPELNELVAKVGSQRGGEITHLYKLLFYSPPLADGWLHIITAVRQQSKISVADQELVIMLIAVINKALFEYKSHAPKALALGFTQAQFDAIPNWQNSKEFDERQRVVLAYTDVMTRAVEVPDHTFQAVRAIFGERELIEITALIAAYNMVTRFTVAMHLGS